MLIKKQTLHIQNPSLCRFVCMKPTSVDIHMYCETCIKLILYYNPKSPYICTDVHNISPLQGILIEEISKILWFPIYIHVLCVRINIIKINWYTYHKSTGRLKSEIQALNTSDW